jgi:hypothetical protein
VTPRCKYCFTGKEERERNKKIKGIEEKKKEDKNEHTKDANIFYHHNVKYTL